jgi:Fe-S cluster biogenesis protein NfuA
MNEDETRIIAEPQTMTSCRFTVDRSVYPHASYYFGNRETAQSSPLAKRLFDIEHVSAVLIGHDQLTVQKDDEDEWPAVGRQVGVAIREHVQSGESAVSDELSDAIPPAEEIRSKIEAVLETEINPSVASHDGFVRLIDVQKNSVVIQMGGGCQGCGMASVTLKQGVETAIRRTVPEVGAIVDATDYAAGRNPYYSAP